MAAASQLIARGVAHGARHARRGGCGARRPRPAAGWPPRRRSRRAAPSARATASLAGYLRAEVGGADPPQRLQMAVAYGSAAASLPGSALPSPAPDRSQCRSGVCDLHPRPPVPSTPQEKVAKCPSSPPTSSLSTSTPAATRRPSSACSPTGSPPPGVPPTATDSIAAAMAREAQSATGLPGGIAIPHCRSPHVDTATIAFARLSPKVDFGAPDGPADLAFLIAAPDVGRRRTHEAAVEPGTGVGAQGLRRVAAQRGVGRRGGRAGRGCGQPRTAAPAPRPAAAAPRRRRRSAKTLVAITACPTGIAHTYMAADSLAAAAKEAGVTLHVETQGSSGSTPLSAETIAARRRRHLRHRRRRQGQGPLRGQARHRLRRQARHQRARQDDRRSRCAPRTIPTRRGSRARAGAPAAASAPRRAASAGAPAPGRSCSPASAT